MTNELPEPWASELAPKGLHSYRDVGSKAGVAHETIRRLMTGGSTSARTVKKVATELFDGDVTKVWQMYGAAVQDYGPWELPPEATLLNQEQREAVLAVVRAMLPPTARGGDGDADRTEPGGSAPKTLRPVDTDLYVDEAAYDPDQEK